MTTDTVVRDETNPVGRVRRVLDELGFSTLWAAPTPSGTVEMFVHKRHAGQVMLQMLAGPKGAPIGWDVFFLADRTGDEEVTIENLRRWTRSFKKDAKKFTATDKLLATRAIVNDLHARLSGALTASEGLDRDAAWSVVDDLMKLVANIDESLGG